MSICLVVAGASVLCESGFGFPQARPPNYRRFYRNESIGLSYKVPVTVSYKVPVKAPTKCPCISI